MVSYIIKSTAHRQERRFNSHASTHKGVLCANGAVHPKISKPRNGIVLTFVYFCNETKISCNNPYADYAAARVVVPIHLNNGTNPSQINFAVPEMEPFFFAQRAITLHSWASGPAPAETSDDARKIAGPDIATDAE